MSRETSPLLFLRFLLGVIAVAALIWIVDFGSVLGVLQNLSWQSFALLMALSFVMVGVSAWKWQRALRALGAQESFLHLMRLYLVGYFVNLFIPSLVGGDVVRSWYVGRRIGHHEALAATIFERFSGLAAMVVMAGVAVTFAPGVTEEMRVGVVTVVTLFVVGTIVALCPPLVGLVRRWVPFPKVIGHIERLRGAFMTLARHPRVVVEMVVLSFLYHVLTVANTWACGVAIGWLPPSMVDLAVVVPLILILGAVPITPAGVGVHEGIFLYFLVLIGASPAEALSVALVLRAKSIVLALGGGLIWFTMKRSEREELQQR